MLGIEARGELYHERKKHVRSDNSGTDNSGTENQNFTGEKGISPVSRVDCRFHGIGPKTADFTDP